MNRRENESEVTARHFDTRAVHAGENRPVPGSPDRNGDGEEGALPAHPMSTPIYASTTFSHPDMAKMDRVLGGEETGYSYARWGNPTTTALEAALSDMEDPFGDGRAFAVSSGMSAMHAAITAAEPGGGVVLAADQLYGSTVTLLLQIFAPLGVEVRFFDSCDLDDTSEKVTKYRPRAVIVESLSNPLLRVADVQGIAEITREAGAALIVDNTFGTPYLQRPLELGADIVVHSATKYIAGHGDLTAGVVAARAPYDSALEQIRKTVGYVMDPFGAWLTLRGLKTLSLRMARQCENAREVARFLAEHPKVSKVHHPSMEDHPDAGAVESSLSDSGGLVSFDVGGDRETAFDFLDALELCVRAPSLGDIYSIATHPATASHREVPPSRREKLGVTEGLIRLSVGIEHHRDIIADLDDALGRI